MGCSLKAAGIHLVSFVSLVYFYFESFQQFFFTSSCLSIDIWHLINNELFAETHWFGVFSFISQLLGLVRHYLLVCKEPLVSLNCYGMRPREEMAQKRLSL